MAARDALACVCVLIRACIATRWPRLSPRSPCRCGRIRVCTWQRGRRVESTFHIPPPPNRSCCCSCVGFRGHRSRYPPPPRPVAFALSSNASSVVVLEISEGMLRVPRLTPVCIRIRQVSRQSSSRGRGPNASWPMRHSLVYLWFRAAISVGNEEELK